MVTRSGETVPAVNLTQWQPVAVTFDESLAQTVVSFPILQVLSVPQGTPVSQMHEPFGPFALCLAARGLNSDMIPVHRDIPGMPGCCGWYVLGARRTWYE